MKRAVSNEFMNALQNGELQAVMDIINNDTSLDIELRGEKIVVYYKGLKVLSITEQRNGVFKFEELDKKYSRRKNGTEPTLPSWNKETPDAYFMQAKTIIDTYDMKRDWEAEIKQMVVRENNTSPNADDTDFWVIDTEYQNDEENKFDIVALHLDSSQSARINGCASIAIIEIKQGISTLFTTDKNPGIRRHLEDFRSHKNDPNRKNAFISDMVSVFKQKYQLGMINGLNDNVVNRLEGSDEIDFYVLLANYKKASTKLKEELNSFTEDCQFLTSFFTGYGLYSHCIKNKDEIVKLL